MERPVSGAVGPQMTLRTRTLWGPQPGRMGKEEEAGGQESVLSWVKMRAGFNAAER